MFKTKKKAQLLIVAFCMALLAAFAFATIAYADQGGQGDQGDTGGKITFVDSQDVSTVYGSMTVRVSEDGNNPVTVAGNIPDNPSKEGFVFDGWYSDPLGITPWTFNAKSITKDITVYAGWKKETPHDPDPEPDPTPVKPDKHKGDKGGKDVKDSKKDVKDAKGGKDVKDNKDGDKGSKELAKAHNVYFDTNAPSINPTSVVPELGVARGALVIKPADPTAEDGWWIIGWYKDPGCTKPWDFAKDKMGKCDLTLYANWNWTRPLHNVYFDTNAPSIDPTPVDPELGVGEGLLVTKPADPTATGGWWIIGWYKDPECTQPWDFDTDTLGKEDMTLYANWNWTRPMLQVIFNSEGGSSVDSEIVGQYLLVLKPADPTKDGFNFGGWFKDEACTEPWDFASDQMGAVDMTLYAKWNQIPGTQGGSTGDETGDDTEPGGSEATPVVAEPIKELPTSGLPVTGDTLSTSSLIAALLIGATAGTGVVIIRKRRMA